MGKDLSDLSEKQDGTGRPFGLYLEKPLVEVCLEGGVLMTSTEVLLSPHPKCANSFSHGGSCGSGVVFVGKRRDLHVF